MKKHKSPVVMPQLRGSDVRVPERAPWGRLAGIPMPALLSSLQRTAGNAAVTVLLVQRKVEEGGAHDAAAQREPASEEGDTRLDPLDEEVLLQAQEPIPIPPRSEM